MLKTLVHNVIVMSVAIFILIGCSSNTNKKNETTTDSLSMNADTSVDTNNQTNNDTDFVSYDSNSIAKESEDLTNKSIVSIYNFHITNRCVTCIAIEEATTKTLNTYFSSELKQGRIKRHILNVDDDANKTVSEKYQAFGSGLFVTRIFKGTETTTDLTGDGFKYAKNKEEKFIELLKNQILEYLK